MNEEEININIQIINRTYPLTIKKREEESIRRVGKEINKIIKDFEINYALKDTQDSLSLCLLHFAVKYEQLKTTYTKEQQIINSEVESLLQLFQDNKDNACIDNN